MKPDMDLFAGIAAQRYAGRDGNLVAPEPIPVPDRVLPLDRQPARSAFRPAAKLHTAEGLRKELTKYRKKMTPFLADHAPAMTDTRIAADLAEFDWRVEREADRRDFPATLAGDGAWQRVSIPHYGPPLGRAVTYYRTTFTVTPTMLERGAMFVAFDGVDYRADVFVNGSLLGSHEGFFAPFEFECTGHVRPGENTLLVKVSNDYVCMGNHDGGEAIDGDKIYAATGLGYDDPALGWHHGPPGMGVCQKVRIEGRSRLFVRDVFVRPLPDDDKIEAWIEVFNCDAKNLRLSFECGVFGQNFKAVAVKPKRIEPLTTDIRGHGDLDKQLKACIPEPAGPGVSYYRVQLELPRARRWDLDSPWLYQLQVKLLDDAGRVCDTRRRQFGMRTFCQDENSEPKGKFILNGREVRLRGANTMGHEQQCVFRGNLDQLVEDILLARLCNMNFLRLTQRPVQQEVYDYCDRLGLMTQTDLPLFGCLRRNQLCEAIRQAEEMERVVRVHPCNVVVSYINEPFPNGQGKPHRNLVRHELENFFDMASRAIRMANPERVIKYVDGDYDPPASAGMPDNHCYCGWYIGHAIDLGKLNRGYWLPIKVGWHYGCGEFGAEGLDSIEVMRKYYPKDWLPPAGQPQSLPWRPDKISLSQTNRFQYLWYEGQQTPEAWIEASQEFQAWIIRLMTESFRRDARMITFAVHLFIDAWPAGWMKTLMDTDRTPKKAYFAYRDALAPLMASLRTDRWSFFAGETVEMEAWICNDTHDVPAGATLRYQLEVDGRAVQAGHAIANVPRCSAEPQGMVRFVLPAAECRPKATVRLALTDGEGRVLHDTAQTIEVFPAAPKLAGNRVFILGERNGKAASLARELGLSCVFSGDPAMAKTILSDDYAAWHKHRGAIAKAVDAGATAVLLELPAGVYRIDGDEINVVPGGMGKRHFVSCGTGHALVEDFATHDFRFWHDAAVGYPTPLLETVVDPPPASWTTILGSGNGSWQTAWNPVPACLEKRRGQGVVRLCQVQLPHRTQGNPAAAIFAARLLGIAQK
jgi:hypothetical protein